MTRSAVLALSLISLLASTSAGQGNDPYFSGSGSGAPAPSTPIANQPPAVDDRIFIGAREFTLPVQVNDPETLELRLFVSRDGGATWDFTSRHTPRENAIAFSAPTDGEFGFYLHAMTRSNPSPIPVAFPGALRVVIDTQRPIFDAIAFVDEGGGLGLRWSASDLNVDPASVAVAFRAKVSAGPPAQWQPLMLPPLNLTDDPLNRTVVVWPNTDQRVLEIQFRVADRAGNAAELIREVQFPSPSLPGAAIAIPPAQASPVNTTTLANAQEFAGPTNVTWNPSNGTTSVADTGVVGADPPPPTRSAFVTPAATGPGENWGTTVPQRDEHPETRAEQANRLPTYALTPEASSQVQSLPASSSTPVSPEPEESEPFEELPPPISSRSEPVFNGAQSGSQGSDYDWSGLPETIAAQSEYAQVVSSPRFRLAYDVDSVGTQGIAKVQLWLTADGGATWTPANEDPDCTSPISVELPSEGVFGFHLVVTARNGLAGDPPRAGQTPDMWVIVDQSEPQVELVDALVGEGSDYGKLIIHWRAQDPHLGKRPISLRYSESANGPWQVIASGLPNTGEYAWTVVPSLPKHFFLRVEVEDRAGNVGGDNSPLPVDLSSLVPRGTLRGFVDPERGDQ